jgi:hypothetical protein
MRVRLNPEIFWGILMIILLLIPGATLGLLLRAHTCHAQCGHGDRQCQKRCLDKGVCPYQEE